MDLSHLFIFLPPSTKWLLTATAIIRPYLSMRRLGEFLEAEFIRILNLRRRGLGATLEKASRSIELISKLNTALPEFKLLGAM